MRLSLSLSSTIITFCISSSKVAIDEIARGKSRRPTRRATRARRRPWWWWWWFLKARFGRLECFFHALKVSCFPMLCVNSHYHHHHLSLYQKEAYGFAGAVLSAVLFLGHLSLIFFSSPDDDDSDDDALARVVRFVTRCAVAVPLWGTFAVVFYVVAVECLSRARVFDVSDERLLSQKKSSTTQARRRQKRGDGGHDAGVFAAGECADAREWNEALFSPPRG